MSTPEPTPLPPVASESPGLLADRVITVSQWPQNVMNWGMLLVVAILVARVLKKTKFPLMDSIDLPINQAWLPMAVVTIIHAVTALIVANDAKKLWRTNSDAECRRAFDEVSNKGGPIVNGLIPRVVIFHNPEKGVSWMKVRMDWRDRSTWFAHVAALLLFAALIPWKWLPFGFGNLDWEFMGLWLAALAITVLNWEIASQWIVPLSLLWVPHAQADEYPLLRAMGFQ
jgi:hypothetical protein